MTLLGDLQALDLSQILNAKASISVTVSGDSLQALLTTGAAGSVMGELGAVLNAATSGLDDPQALVEPLVAAFTELAGRVGPGELPLGEYVEAVSAGARTIAVLVGALAGDPRALSTGGASIGDVLDAVGGPLGDHAVEVGSGLSRFRALVESVEAGLPDNPTELIGPALQILLPFGIDGVDSLRSQGLALAARLDGLTIDPRLTSGLVTALADVRIAAEAGDRVRVEAALRALATVRMSTVEELADAIRRIAGGLSALDVEAGLREVLGVRQLLSNADSTVFDTLDGWRQLLAELRALVHGLDPASAMTHASAFLDIVEQRAQEFLFDAIDRSVEIVKQALRDLLREIPLRPLRLQLSEGIAGIATAIADADLDAPVVVIRGGLAEAARVIGEADPAALVQEAVQQLEAVLSDALDSLQDSLGAITEGINAVAAEAEALLRRAVEGLRDFREVVDQLSAAIEDAGILEAAREIAEQLQELREQVSTLLAEAPVPDVLRESVGQLVDVLESINIEEQVQRPLEEIARSVRIPDDVAATVRAGLEAMADAVTALVPTDVIADLDAMVSDLLAEIQNLDPAPLTGGITAALDEAEALFRSVRFVELVEPAGAAFDEVLAAIDRAHPRTVLAPVISLYNDILGRLPLPSPDSMTTRAATVASAAGESAARAAAEPVTQAVSGRSGATGSATESGPAREEQPDDLRPGDVIRLVGFLPAKLREALAGMDGGPARDVLAQVDQLLAGTAGVLRDLRDRLATLDHALASSVEGVLDQVTPAHVDALVALEGSLVVDSDGFDVDASFGLLASAGPSGLRDSLAGELALVGGRAQAATGALTGSLAHDLDAAAEMLDAVLPSGVMADLDAFLAALDPEPLAAEFDALLAAVVDATPAFLSAAEAEIRELEARIRRLLAQFNPGALVQRYLAVLDVIREELSLLDPGRLADELGEVHVQVRAAVQAYDPRRLAAELDALLDQVAGALDGLDPANLMPDLSGISEQVARVTDLLPVRALEGVGTSLTAVGDELREIDLQALLDAVNGLTPQIVAAVTELADAVRDEFVALLNSIQYASPSGSVSVRASGSIG